MVVCDSAPLIHLSRTGKLRLLRTLFDEVLIPPCVEPETVTEAKELGKPGVGPIQRGIEKGWIKLRDIQRKEAKGTAANENIELEDASVLQLAKETSSKLVTSDSWLVKVARVEGVETLWTTTLVLMAVGRKEISKKEGKELLKELAKSGLYLKSSVYADLIDAIENL